MHEGAGPIMGYQLTLALFMLLIK